MKKITLSIIIIFICFASYAHIGHYSKYKKIEMEILRNNELIGYNYYFFSLVNIHRKAVVLGSKPSNSSLQQLVKVNKTINIKIFLGKFILLKFRAQK